MSTTETTPAAATAAAAASAPAAAATTTAPAAATTTAAPAAAATTTPDYKWAGDETAQALAQKKGWASPGDALKSYTELEGLLGGEKLPLPKDEGDKVGWDRVHAALGRPETPEAYGLKLPETASDTEKALAGEYGKLAHELGLSTKAANALLNWNQEKAGAIQTAMQAQNDARMDTEIAAVKDNWGQNFNANAEIARRGSDALGFDKATIEALEASPQFGHKKLMDMLLKVGQASGEGNGLRNGGGNGFGPVTKESAQARLDEIKASPQLRSEALKQNSDINKEVDRLDKIIAGVRPDA